MKITDVFPSEFLKSADLGGIAAGKRVRVTIADVKFWEDSTGARKLSIGFNGTKKRLLANVTNARTIAKSYGEETEAWVGKPVILYVQMVDFRGTSTEALRIIIPPEPSPSALPPNQFRSMQGPQNPAPAVDNVDAFGIPNEMNDEIPF